MWKQKCSITLFIIILLALQSIQLIAQSKQITNPSREITTADTSKQVKTLDVGYLELPRSEFTGNISSIGNQDFNQGLMVSPQELIIGRMPGVSVISDDGAPGANAQILIRGGSSILFNDPLIIVDGVIFSDEDLNGVRNPLSLINSQDIERITVLKDASAAAIYGGRANNGVILVTTKRGQTGSKLQLNYHTQLSLGTLPNRIEVFDAAGYKNYLQERIASGDIPDEAVGLLGEADTDWQDLIYQNALSTNHNLAISGAIAQKLPFRASLGYLNHEGILRNTGLERVSTAINLDPSFFKNQLKFQLNFKGNFTKNTYVPERAISAAVYFDPTQAVSTDQDIWGGYFFWPRQDNPNLPAIHVYATPNPVAMLEQTDHSADVDRMISNASLTYAPKQIPGLAATFHLGWDRTQSDELDIIPPDAAFSYFNNTITVVEGEEPEGRRYRYEAEYRNEFWETYLSYHKILPVLKSEVDIVVGYSQQEFFQDFAEEEFRSRFTSSRGRSFGRSYTTYWGRLHYALNQKYLLDFTFRRNGSSLFTNDNRWDNHHGLSLAWIISQENFLKYSNILSQLKLRLAWGSTRQENQRTISNLDLKGEVLNSYDIGVDFNFWNGKIIGGMDYFFHKSSDLIITLPISNVSGTGNIFSNTGALENKGLELNLQTRVLSMNDWRLDIGFNLARVNQKITKLFSDIYIRSNRQVHRLGERRNAFLVLEQIYDNQGIPISGEFVDQNQDGLIRAFDDQVTKGAASPNVILGLSTSLAYKNFSLNLNGRMHKGNYVFNNTRLGLTLQNVYLGNNLNNTDASGFKLNPDRYRFYRSSDYYLEKATFFRMDNITLGYNFNKLFTNRINATLSFTIQNAFVISSYSGLDPELANGIDDHLYPRPRNFVLSLNVNFQ